MNTPKRTMPSIPILDKRFQYRNSAKTDVTITWDKARQQVKPTVVKLRSNTK